MARLGKVLVPAVLLAALLGFLLLRKPAGATPEATPRVPLYDLVIETDHGPVTLKVELATTPEAWQKGLMFRESLPENQGMLFIFPQATGSAFWMKNTRIPLSIAFADQNGVILRILDMEPCEEDPCPSYYPGVAYRQALEVNQGWFARHGVKEGDRWKRK